MKVSAACFVENDIYEFLNGKKMFRGIWIQAVWRWVGFKWLHRRELNNSKSCFKENKGVEEKGRQECNTSCKNSIANKRA